MADPVPPTSSIHDPTGPFDLPIYHAETRAQVRAWLEHHHSTAKGVWLCSWRGASAHRPRCPYPEVVEEALCFGWIDSTVRTIDDHRGMQLLTPPSRGAPGPASTAGASPTWRLPDS